MSPKGQSRNAFAQLPKGVKRTVLQAQSDGKPISFWLTGKGKDHFDKAFAQLGDQPLYAFVWQQGESNQSRWFSYEAEFTELLQSIRQRANNPEVKIIINQLGPRRQKTGTLANVKMNKHKKLKANVFKSYWDMALMREVQRRIALSDPHIEIVATVDLQVKDGIHFNGDSQKEIGRRVGLVASGHGGGPVPTTVKRDAADPNTVLFHFDRVSGNITMVDGWQTNIALSPKPATPIPEQLGDWQPVQAMHPTVVLPPDDLVYPTDVTARDATTLAITFNRPVQAGDLLHWGYDVGANDEGDNETQPSLTGITDDTGIAAVAASMLPIQ